jgi:hypothetical protein
VGVEKGGRVVRAGNLEEAVFAVRLFFALCVAFCFRRRIQKKA